jgi:hypothetical protein
MLNETWVLREISTLLPILKNLQEFMFGENLAYKNLV